MSLYYARYKGEKNETNLRKGNHYYIFIHQFTIGQNIKVLPPKDGGDWSILYASIDGLLAEWDELEQEVVDKSEELDRLLCGGAA